MAISNCDTGKQPSRIPGNIGTLKSKVIVWDHDPLLARPHQVMSWFFTSDMAEQMRETVPTVFFELGGVMLRPIFKRHDMFVCTTNDNKTEPSTDSESVNFRTDFVGSPESGVGQIAQDKMPGGSIYLCNGGKAATESSDSPCARFVTDPETGEEVRKQVSDPDTGRDIFVHQVWRHTGSLLKNEVLIHPSEYGLPYSQLGAVEASFEDEAEDAVNRAVLEELQSSAKWDYIEHTINGRAAIWPQLTTKHSPSLGNSIHWTLEKWTPVWQGQDFFVSIKLGDKETDDTRDPDTGFPSVLAKPYNNFLNYDIDQDSKEGRYPGITNAAFYVPKKKATPNGAKSQQQLDEETSRQARAAYDWRYKTYILIEIGVLDTQHNYFIELVKGRKPRFLHLGEEWDHPGRLEDNIDTCDASGIFVFGQEIDVNDECKQENGFNFYRKCREISVYEHLICDELFKQDFAFSVRNHLGRMVVTFEGYEGQPWVIERKDNDPTKRDFSKIITPMVVPSAPVRIHGGNISCAINYSPTQYMPFALIPFPNRQIDTGPDNEDKVKNEDVFISFSNMGNSVQYSNPNVQENFFNDPRLELQTIGYDCDSYLIHEVRHNTSSPIKIYEEFDKQYRTYGKGYYNKTPRKPEDDTKVDRDDDNIPNPTTEVNAMSDSQGGTPSLMRIVNISNQGLQSFPLKLTGRQFAHYEWSDVVAKWDVGIELQAGSVKIYPPTGKDALPVSGAEAKIFENYITPIATTWRIIVLGDGKPFEKSTTSFDVAPLVSNISDSWSAEDFTSLSHEMQMECYIPIESTGASNPSDIDDTDLINLFNTGRKMLALHDKTFYLTISYWWEDGIGHRYVESNEFNSPGDNPNNNDVLIQMTGLAYGAQLTRSNNKLIMSFTVKDYMTILENQFLFNSPFFDAVQDVYAVYELAKLAGLDDDATPAIGIDRRPLGYLRKVIADGDRIGERLFTYNGEKSRSERYDLPGTYSSFVDPKVKFQNGETYENAVKRIAQLSGKAIYFDRWGVLRLETPPALTAAFSSASDDLDLQLVPVFDFVSTPVVRGQNVPDAGGEGSSNDFNFDPTIHAAHLVYNALTYQRSVEECSNQIIIMSASNDLRDARGERTGGFIFEGYTFFDQLWKPESEGFIGYRKPMYQEEGAFGSVQGVRNAIGIYAKKKFPPVIMNFETYGVPGLKALDIITLDGNLGYITEISHELDPAENRWWMNITAEWLKPIKGELGFLEAIEPATSTDGEE